MSLRVNPRSKRPFRQYVNAVASVRQLSPSERNLSRQGCADKAKAQVNGLQKLDLTQLTVPPYYTAVQFILCGRAVEFDSTDMRESRYDWTQY